MIKELKIENLALIDELDIELEKGLIVLTGETGAGKSIILNGLSLLAGDKANKELISKNYKNVYVEAILELNNEQINKLEELGYEFDDELIISREFSIDNNKVKINGKRFNLTSLKEISKNILDIVGQHDQQYLLNSNYHLSLLDKFINKEIEEYNKEISSYILNINKIDKEIKELKEEMEDIKLKKDKYTQIVKEIFEEKFTEDDEEFLNARYNELFNSGLIKEKVNNAYNILNSINLKNAKKELEKIAAYSDKYNELYDRISNMYEENSDLIYEFDNILNNLDDNEYEIEEIYNKLNKIKNLKLKYGKTIKEINEYGNNIKNKLDNIYYSNDILEEKEKSKKEYLEKYEKITSEMTNIRKKTAIFLKEKVESELIQLNMPNVKFDVNFEKLDRLNINGNDGVKFMISTNKGSDLKELSKIASGGEISRIMLALKIVFSDVDNITTLVFDEIDTGISGETIIKIASKLKELSKKVQIICVTHSIQIAAKADIQFKIYKKEEDGVTHSYIKKLNLEERIEEIARIISGDKITEASLKISKEMIES